MHGVARDLVARILRIADFQRGLISYEQLVSCGLDGQGIRRLCRRGWLRQVHRGVFLVGSAAPVPWRRETAAWLALAPSSVIVHRSSLALWNVCSPNDEMDVHVAVPGRQARSRPGIVVHRAAWIDPCDLGHCQRLPVTMPARALLEAACDLDAHELERMVDEALALGLVTRPELLHVTERYPTHRGVRIIREHADPDRASEITGSQAESRYATILRKAKAPPSEAQYRIGPYTVDRCWPDLKVVVEVDGTQFHRDRKRMERDNHRQDVLRHHGQAVTRFTRRQVVYEPEYVAFRTGLEIGLAMGRAAAPGG